MTKPATNQYKQQRQDIQKQMDALEEQIEAADEAGEDTSALEDQLRTLKTQRDAAHDAWRQDVGGKRGGKANAPGQQKKSGGGGTTGGSTA